MKKEATNETRVLMYTFIEIKAIIILRINNDGVDVKTNVATIEGFFVL